MSDGINITNGKASMAYIGETPWHGRGNPLAENASIEDWIIQSGMCYEILPGELQFLGIDGTLRPVESKIALYRSDTMESLGVVGRRYKVVQPEEVLEFFRDLTEERGFVLETAGVLFNGSKYWAMARTPHHLKLAGGDEVKEHLLLATACDGSMATTGRYLRTRVVCKNTLEAGLSEKGGKVVRVEHRSTFNAQQVKQELKILDEAWDQFAEQAAVLSKKPVSHEEAQSFLINLLGDEEKSFEDQTAPTVTELFERFSTGAFLGSTMKSSRGTWWGLVQTITEHVDWHRGDIQDRRLKSAWFGKGAELKVHAFNEALKLAA